jgi:hypothetical protein
MGGFYSLTITPNLISSYKALEGLKAKITSFTQTSILKVQSLNAAVSKTSCAKHKESFFITLNFGSIEFLQTCC